MALGGARVPRPLPQVDEALQRLAVHLDPRPQLFELIGRLRRPEPVQGAVELGLFVVQRRHQVDVDLVDRDGSGLGGVQPVGERPDAQVEGRAYGLDVGGGLAGRCARRVARRLDDRSGLGFDVGGDGADNR